MKILFWTEFYLPHLGGIEVLVQDLSAALRARGHECLILTNRQQPEWPEEEILEGIPVHRVAWERALREGPLAVARVVRHVRQLRETFAPQVEHFFLSGALVMLQQMAKPARPVPQILAVHTLVDRLISGGESMVRQFHSAQAITSATRLMQEELQTAFPASADKVCVISNAIPDSATPPLPLPLTPPVLLFIGRLVIEKGLDVALQAMKLLMLEFPEITLQVAGDGDQRASLQALAEALGLSSRVTFCGVVPRAEVMSWLNRGTIVLVPSRWEEPFGIVNVEAALMQRPVIASRVGGIGEVVVDGETGLLVEKEDPVQLAAAIRSLLLHPERLQSMGERARQRALSVYGFDSFIASHLRLYESASHSTRD